MLLADLGVSMEALTSFLEDRAVALLVLVGAIVGAVLVHILVFRLLGRWARHTAATIDDLIVSYLRRPTRLLVPVVVALVLLAPLGLPEGAHAVARHGLILMLIAAIGWTIRNVLLVLRDVVLSRYDVSRADNLEARRVHTQVRILQRVVMATLVIVVGSIMLMTFDSVRQVGVSLLASAGVVGVILGFSAQRSIATLFAGVQLAITQPIRIDDVVIVEGEWGRIEEITLTYVVVRIWDLRRLVVPVTYFIEKPFQNWTRISADILGTIYIHADYRIPVEAVREELKRIVAEQEEWDGKVCGLQVTGAGADTVELRALVSAADASKAWDLRCAVREKLLDYLHREHPDCLPRVRAEVAASTVEDRPGFLPGPPDHATSDEKSP